VTGLRASILALAIVLGSSTAEANEAGGAEPVVEIELRPDLDHPGPVFEGWGTALAWYAHITGGWPDAEREELADLLFGKEGLGLTIARYNIGGGNAPDTEDYLRVGADIPGFWRKPIRETGSDWWDPDDPAMWDWSADANQRWWLDAVKQRVAQPIFEAFSNSPPYFLTVSGLVSGHEDRRTDNLRPGAEASFAQYLVRVTAEIGRRHGIHFRTLSPINEPGTDYWHAANTQEGSHWGPASQARMIDATYAALQSAGLETVVAAPDETSSDLFLADWAAYPRETRARIGQINIHSYGNLHQTAVRDIARANNIRLWMSENDTPRVGDGEDFNGMATSLAFAEHVVLDLRRLEPSAWVFWQAVETFSAIDGKKGTNWGLIKADLRAESSADHRITITKKYWALAQFSRFIRPGFKLVPIADVDTVAALSPDADELVMVHVNAGLQARELSFPDGWHVAAIATDSDRNAQCISRQIAEPGSITTFVLMRDSSMLPCQV